MEGDGSTDWSLKNVIVSTRVINVLPIQMYTYIACSEHIDEIIQQ